MSHRSYTRRNRPVTACRECHRRKQKCDRLKPCNICLARNVPEKCLYGDDMLKLVNSAKRKEKVPPLTPPSDSGSDSATDHEDEPMFNTLDEQIGYSALSDNAFIDLYKSIDAVHIPTAGSLGLSTVPLKPNLKEKYFKIVTQLPSTSICISLVDTYFHEADWYFVSLDRYYFKRLHAAWIASALPDEQSVRLEQYPRDLQHFPALLFQVLAVGLQFSLPGSTALESLNLGDRTASDKQSQLYSDCGCEIMEVLGRQLPSITGVEQDIMRMTWLKNCSRGSESRHSVGNALSQAHDLELHLESDLAQSAGDVTVSTEQLWYDEYRRRVWTRLFLLDSHMSLVLGRPRHIHLDDCTATLPTDCDIPEDLTNTRPVPPQPGEVPSSFTYVIFLYQIGLKIHETMSAKYKKVSQYDYREVDRVHREVEGFLVSLPPALRPQNPDTTWDRQRPHFPKIRQQILSTANSFLMKLHRPYINTNEASRNAVIRAAVGTLDAQQELYELMSSSKNQHRIYGFSFYTIDAAILLSAVVINRRPQSLDMVQHINRSLQQAIGRLGLLRGTSPVAASGEQLLMQCYAKINACHPEFMVATGESHMAPIHLDLPSVAGDFKFLDDFTLPDRQEFELGNVTEFTDRQSFHG